MFNKKQVINSTQKNGKESYEEYRFIEDPRSPDQIASQSQIGEQIYVNNLDTLGVRLTAKAKVKYEPAELKKLQFQNGWFAMVTDSGLLSQSSILTIHGSPGDHREWAGLETEMDGSCRWINFILPGFDGMDERRGTYSGSVQDIAKLIILVLNELKVAQVVLCGHSMGSILSGYLLDAHPQYFRGYINVTGIVNYWYIGLKTFYRVTVGAYGFGSGPNRSALLRLLNKDEYREKHHARFISDTRDVYFGKVQFPDLTQTEMAAYIKLFSSIPKGSSEFYALNRKISLLRVLIFGKKDPLHSADLVYEQIYSICRGEHSYMSNPKTAKIVATAKQELERTLHAEFGVKIEAEKIQEYFCYYFYDTGHNAHKRRPKEISRIIRIYLVTLRVLEKYENLTRTSL